MHPGDQQLQDPGRAIGVSLARRLGAHTCARYPAAGRQATSASHSAQPCPDPLGDHLHAAAVQVDRQRPDGLLRDAGHRGVAADEQRQPGQIQVAGVLAWAAAAPQPVADVGGRFVKVGALEVDDASRQRRAAGDDDVVGGEVAIDHDRRGRRPHAQVVPSGPVLLVPPG